MDANATMYPSVAETLNPPKQTPKRGLFKQMSSFLGIAGDEKPTEAPEPVEESTAAPQCPETMYPSVYDKLSEKDSKPKLKQRKSILGTITFGLLGDDEKDVQTPQEEKGRGRSFIETIFGAGETPAPAEETIIPEEEVDPKDTETFKYEKYTELPEFTDEHKSLMSKLLTEELFEKLKDVKTSKGYTLSNAIQTGVKTPHLGVGITAGDEESWEAFKEIMYPVIKGWHKFDPETDTHKVDLDASKLVFSEESCTTFDSYVVSTRIRAARNVSGYALPAGALADDRVGVEKVLTEAFDKFDGELKGKYYRLGDLTEDETTNLQKLGFLFQKPKPTNLLWHAGAARSWPDNRGIFHNDERTALCWVNEEDHCRIISMEDGGNVKNVFKRFCTISNALKEAAENNGTKLMFSEKLGFLGTCPSNLGTGLRASVMIKLPKLNEDPAFLEVVCAKFDLQPRGSAGEHSAAEGAKWDISNKQRIGFSEVELVQKMIDGVTLIIRIEELLADGSKTKEEIEALLDNPDELMAQQDVVLEETDVPSPGDKKVRECCTIA